MRSRRSFLAGAAGLGLAVPTFAPNAMARLLAANKAAGQASPLDVAQDEDYWSGIQRAFDIDRTLIYLNNGGCCPSPTHVLEQMIRDLKFSNEAPTHHMWRILDPRVETVRRELAREFGCDPEELAIKRNASEAMETLIFGIDLERGDEVIVTDQNYPRMLTSWDQRARREGIVVKRISFDVPLPSPAHFVAQIEAAITEKTRVIEFPHVTNLSGQILPVREVADLAKKRGIELFIDGAHGFAHFPFTRDDLNCDYYGTSLHKWLLAPIGTGFLYIRKEKQKKIWPLMGADEALNDDVRKYEQIGTHPAANFNAIEVALTFHRGIGVERRAARMRYLRDRWARRLREASDRVKLWTPIDDEKASCGIALVQIEGIDTGSLYGHLLGKYQIITSPTVHEQYEGVRVTPNVYTTAREIDVFSDAMLDVLKDGFPVEKKPEPMKKRDVRRKDGTRNGRELTTEQKQKDVQDARDKESKEMREAKEAKDAREAKEKDAEGGRG